MKLINLDNNLKINSRLIRLVFLSLSIMIFSNVSSGGSKDCYTCNPDYVPGNPVEGNKTLGQLAQVSMDLISRVDGDFMSNLYGFCIEFPGDIKGAKTLRKRVITEMEKKAVNGSIDLYFLEAGCNPGDIGRTLSPISHLVAEYPGSRLEHLEVLRKYFLEKKKDGLFVKMLNAKNTQGHTTLDYVQFLKDNGKYIESQKEAIENLINYLCTNGGKYSVYSSKSCSGLQMAVK